MRQPVIFCVNNNPSNNNRISDCGAIQATLFAPCQQFFLFAECYARQSVNNIQWAGNSIFRGKSSRQSVLEHYRKLA